MIEQIPFCPLETMTTKPIVRKILRKKIAVSLLIMLAIACPFYIFIIFIAVWHNATAGIIAPLIGALIGVTLGYSYMIIKTNIIHFSITLPSDALPTTQFLQHTLASSKNYRKALPSIDCYPVVCAFRNWSEVPTLICIASELRDGKTKLYVSAYGTFNGLINPSTKDYAHRIAQEIAATFAQ